MSDSSVDRDCDEQSVMIITGKDCRHDACECDARLDCDDPSDSGTGRDCNASFESGTGRDCDSSSENETARDSDDSSVGNNSWDCVGSSSNRCGDGLSEEHDGDESPDSDNCS